jgi:hypothetical protein
LPRFRTDYAVERAVLVTELRQFLLHSNNSLLPPDMVAELLNLDPAVIAQFPKNRPDVVPA